jgi:hypothetical protein
MRLTSLNVVIMVSVAPDIICSIQRFTLLRYLRTPSNVLDWVHFAMMIFGWKLWYAHVDRTERFAMEPGYSVLSSIADQTPARLLLTNAEEEARFLRFSQELGKLNESLQMYTNVVSICGASPVWQPVCVSVRPVPSCLALPRDKRRKHQCIFASNNMQFTRMQPLFTSSRIWRTYINNNVKKECMSTNKHPKIYTLAN